MLASNALLGPLMCGHENLVGRSGLCRNCGSRKLRRVGSFQFGLSPKQSLSMSRAQANAETGATFGRLKFSHVANQSAACLLGQLAEAIVAFVCILKRSHSLKHLLSASASASASASTSTSATVKLSNTNSKSLSAHARNWSKQIKAQQANVAQRESSSF